MKMPEGFVVKNKENEKHNAVSIFDSKELITCKNCIHNVANKQKDPLDITDYSGTDIVCDYFMTDGLDSDDFCSHGEKVDRREE